MSNQNQRISRKRDQEELTYTMPKLLRQKKTTKTIQNIFSGKEKGAWKNPRPWIKKRDEEIEQGMRKLIKGKVGRSLIRSIVKLASERAKKKVYRQEAESEESSTNEQDKLKIDVKTKKFGCTAECPIYHLEKGKWKICILFFRKNY
jgi:hypothetical protein